MCLVRRASLRLLIRAIRPSDLGPFVPLQAGPSQVVEQALFGVGDSALLVRVFYTKQELAAGALGQEVIEQGGAEGAEVEIAGGGRREPRAGWCGRERGDGLRVSGGLGRYRMAHSPRRAEETGAARVDRQLRAEKEREGHGRGLGELGRSPAKASH